ncbi:hypothetical protein CMV_023519 [Castanea mollissima]|uniref:PurT/PurK-like preATP-grasp domain-containing protein n=1 Tax=Castanea mollissima TaxID=60419 RepID=A0A8J4VDE9_9ROSI|nr:hypothetical protein CMV_023519 [Castanea mollissima]
MNHSTKQNPLLPSTPSISSLKHSTPVFASRASCDTHETSPSKDDVPVHGLSEVIVGVLGGGQLELPCKCTFISSYSFDDSATVREFVKRWNVLAVEIEHVDVATMEMLEQQGVACQPKASTIRIIQICFSFTLPFGY